MVFFFLHFFIIYHSKKGWCFWGWCFEKGWCFGGWCFVKGWCFEKGLCVEGWSFQKRFDVSEKIWYIQALEIFWMGLMFWKLTFSKGCVSWRLIFWKGLTFWWLMSFQRDSCFGGRWLDVFKILCLKGWSFQKVWCFQKKADIFQRGWKVDVLEAELFKKFYVLKVDL